MNKLYYGDNLQILRDKISSESVDLIYLDPPFNSKRDYNLIFKSPEGEASDAQIAAFEDTWHWNEQAQREFTEIVDPPERLLRLNGETVASHREDVRKIVQAFKEFLGENDMMAYLTMMAARLLELHRVLKPTGSLYLHCDPAASHYLKVLLDGVFGKERFRSEIVWRRSGAHNSAVRYGPIHDTILFYTKSAEFCWNRLFSPYTKAYVKTFFNKKDDKGTYRTQTLSGDGTRTGESGKAWRGYDPTAKGRHWAIPRALAEELGIARLKTHAKLDFMADNGLIVDGEWLPEYRQYLHQSPGVPLQDIWAYQPFTKGVLHGTDDPLDNDVRWISDRNDPERLGYPTQKPLGLLERIIQSSSNKDDVVLDPFCGCGTAVDAAQKLRRRWVGIDITHLAVSLIQNRLKHRYGSRCTFDVLGTPKDLEAAKYLAELEEHDGRYQFQYWAVSLVGARPSQGTKKGADGGVDGIKSFLDLDQKWRDVVVSVKSGKLELDHVRAFCKVREQKKAAIAVLITLREPSRQMRNLALQEEFYTSFTGRQYPRLQILTVADLLAGEVRAEHPDHEPNGNFKKAVREPDALQVELFQSRNHPA